MTDIPDVDWRSRLDVLELVIKRLEEKMRESVDSSEVMQDYMRKRRGLK